MRDIRLFQRNERYQRFFEYIYRNLQYINDFSNISIITQNISTIRQEISTYRQMMTITNKRRLFQNGTVSPFLLRTFRSRNIIL